MGFCRTNLFKRLESSGEAFEQSLERHILRNYVFQYAIENDLALPIGTQEASILDTSTYDEDVDDPSADAELFEDAEDEDTKESEELGLHDDASFRARAQETYNKYATALKKRFKWLRPDLFVTSLAKGIADSVEQLQRAVPYDFALPGTAFFARFGGLYTVYVRGQAYLEKRQGREAAAEFQKVLDHRGIGFADPIGALAHLQLGRAYVVSGDMAKAKNAYQDFLALWKDADPDIPIFKQAKAEYAKLR